MVDKPRSAELARKACEFSHIEACNNLLLMLRRGDGIKKGNYQVKTDFVPDLLIRFVLDLKLMKDTKERLDDITRTMNQQRSYDMQQGAE